MTGRARYLGEMVRFYRFGPGWLFGRVVDVIPADGRGGLEFARVQWVPSTGRGLDGLTETIASFLLEHCEG